ncbi:hypothetical protein CDAR_210331 [Caerostris darwini]|uniref:Uncharacterized protein n=1 Tax=Caerostris darwini TaxID=1538125 RepID=A0AAV4MJL8_9ARAC|nr:hypothetical protein CDAR_210331 [Caerostris darwini]
MMAMLCSDGEEHQRERSSKCLLLIERDFRDQKPLTRQDVLFIATNRFINSNLFPNPPTTPPRDSVSSNRDPQFVVFSFCVCGVSPSAIDQGLQLRDECLCQGDRLQFRKGSISISLVYVVTFHSLIRPLPKVAIRIRSLLGASSRLDHYWWSCWRSRLWGRFFVSRKVVPRHV